MVTDEAATAGAAGAAGAAGGRDTEPLMGKLKAGIRRFKQYYTDGDYSEILIRSAIFVLLVVLVHSIMIWAIFSVFIPVLQTYFMDAALEEAKKNLKNVEWGSYFDGFDI